MIQGEQASASQIVDEVLAPLQARIGVAEFEMAEALRRSKQAEAATAERIAEAIEALCPTPDAEHVGDHCPYREAADTARKAGGAS